MVTRCGVHCGTCFFLRSGALFLGFLSGKRTITWLHIQDFELDAAFELGVLKGQLFRFLAEFLSALSCVAIHVSVVLALQWFLSYYIKAFNHSKHTSFQIGSILIWLSTIKPSRVENPYRHELNIAPDQLVIMYSGSMNKKQGLDVLLQVIYQLSDLPHVVWLLAGEGPTKAELVTATHGLDQVRHLPLQPMERLNDWLNLADIHVPQRAEAAGLVLPSKLLGILASGRPCSYFQAVN